MSNGSFDLSATGIGCNALVFGLGGLVMTIIFFVKNWSDLNIWFNSAEYYYTMVKMIIFFVALFVGIVIGIVICIINCKDSCVDCCIGCRDKMKDVKKETDLEMDGYNKKEVL